MENLVVFDFIEIKVCDYPDSRVRFLGDTNLADIVILYKVCFSVQNRIQFGLVDIDIYPVRVWQFAVGIFS